MPDLFLSYARDDDEPFVAKLYGELRAARFEVWWDRESMPSRSLTFLDEIRAAIHDCPRLVVVVGPHAVVSDYVRAEWQAALVAQRVVVPVLRIADGDADDPYELLPAELRDLHAIDFGAARPWDSAFEELVRVLNDPIPTIGDLRGNVPSLPPHFRPRPDDLTRMYENALPDRVAPATVDERGRVTVLHGMPGAGKSVLAAAFVRSLVTRRTPTFADGVFWLGLEVATAPATVVRRLAALVGVSTAGAPDDLEWWVDRLRQHVEQRRCLVVLDNAWDRAQVQPVLGALGPGGRILVTTRVAELATGVAATAQDLGVLSDEAALDLLADWTGASVESLPKEASEVAGECGNLPFALAVNGAMVADGVSWGSVLEALRSARLDYAEKAIGDYVHPDVARSINVSIDELTARDPAAVERYRELAAFMWDEPVPASAIETLWRWRAHLERSESEKTLARLRGRELLQLDERGRVRLHDLLLDYLRPAAYEQRALNDELVAAYRSAAGGDWPSLEPDGYVHGHLVAHLAASEMFDELHELLALETDAGRHAWHAARAAAAEEGGFVDDVLLAARHVLDGAGNGAAPSADDYRLGVQYLLMTSSVRSRVRNLSAALLAAALRAGLVEPAEAMGQLPSLEHLARIPFYFHVTDELPVSLVATDAYLAPLLALGLPSVLASLLPRLTGEPAARVRTALLDSVRGDVGNADVRALLPHLPALDEETAAAVCSDLLVRVGEWPDPVRRWAARASILGVAPDSIRRHHPVELAPAGDFRRPAERLEALAGCLDALEPDAAVAVAEEVRSGLQTLAASRRPAVAAQLLPFLDADARGEVLATVAAAAAETRVPALMAVAPHLPEELLTACLDANQDAEIDDAAAFAEAGGRQLPPAVRRHLVERLLERHRGAGLGWRSASAAAHLLGLADGSSRAELLAFVLRYLRSETDRDTRNEIWETLAPQLRTEELAHALEVEHAVRDKFFELDAIASLLVSADEAFPGLVSELVGEAQQLGDEDAAMVLWRLQPLCSAAEIEATAEAYVRGVAGIDDVWSQAYMLTTALRYRPHLDRDEVVEGALEVCRTADSEHDRAALLVALAAVAPDSGLDQLRDPAAAIGDPFGRSLALAELATRLTGEAAQEVAEAAASARRAIDHPYLRATAIAFWAERADDSDDASVAAAWLAATEAVTIDEELVTLLTEPAHPWMEFIKPRALATLQWRATRASLAVALRGAVPQRWQHLADTIGRELVPAAADLDGTVRSREILLNLVDVVRFAGEPACHQLIGAVLETWATAERSEVLWSLARLGPIFGRIGGAELVDEVVAAVRRVCRWWP